MFRELMPGKGSVVPASVSADLTRVCDPNDTPSPLDIKCAVARHKRHHPNRLVHRISFYGQNATENIDAGNTFGGGVCLRIWQRRPASTAERPDLLICTLLKDDRVPIFRGDGTTPNGTKATVRFESDALSFVFSRWAINSPPHRYFWQGVSTHFNDNQAGQPCPESNPCRDFVPDDDVVKHRLPAH